MIYLALFLAVAIGYFIALGFKSSGQQQFALLLSFSGAFLLSVTLFEILPELFTQPNANTGLFIMGGILLQLILDFFSKGAEHGHVHLHDKTKAFPWLLFVSLSIHAILEGIPAADHDKLLVGVLVHKIPIAAILALFFIKANYSKSVTIAFMLLFALMSPLGSLLADSWPLINSYSTQINAIVVGIFLHVSTTILFESNKDHGFNLSKMLAIIAGVVIAYFL